MVQGKKCENVGNRFNDEIVAIFDKHKKIGFKKFFYKIQTKKTSINFQLI